MPLYTQKVAEQKITSQNSIHLKWNLAGEPQNYKYSSAKYYYTGKDEFACLPQAGIPGNYMEVMNEKKLFGWQGVCCW